MQDVQASNSLVSGFEQSSWINMQEKDTGKLVADIDRAYQCKNVT